MMAEIGECIYILYYCLLTLSISDSGNSIHQSTKSIASIATMQPLVLLSLLPIAMTWASPLIIRAGAPIASPVPANCSIGNPLLCTSAEECPPVSYEQVEPTTDALTTKALYGYYLPPDSTANRTVEYCEETCYGYGNTGDCQSVYHADNYPAPPMYGAPGGYLTTACLLFAGQLNSTSFDVVPEAQQVNYTNSVVRTISCPSS
jgi:hypothetical protein